MPNLLLTHSCLVLARECDWCCALPQVPKHVYEHRPVEGFAKTHSEPKSPLEVQKPFQLASLEKHET